MHWLIINGSVQKALEDLGNGRGAIPPFALAPPRLQGTVEIGETVSVQPGHWAGLLAPEIETTLFVGGAPRPSPYRLEAGDEGAEIVVTDTVANETGGVVLSSESRTARFPAPVAVGIPEDVVLGADGIELDLGDFFLDAVGGTWTVTSAIGEDVLSREIDAEGRLRLQISAPTDSIMLRIAYSNSGGSAWMEFPASVDFSAPVAAPGYDGSLGTFQVPTGEDAVIEIGAAFSGERLNFAISGLPDGLAFDPRTGRIDGRADAAGRYGVIVVVTNAAGSVDARFEIVIEAAPLAVPVYDGSLRDQNVVPGAAIDLESATGFSGEDLVFSAAGLAPGLSIDPATGRMSGTVSETGAFAVTISASNAAGAAEGSFRIVVAEAGTDRFFPPNHNGLALNLSLATKVEMRPVDMSAGFTGAELRYSADGLPVGLAISEFSGVISGTPRDVSSGGVTVTARNTGGTARASFAVATGGPEIRDEPQSGSEAGGESLGPSIRATFLSTEGTEATVDFGPDEPGRELYVSVLAGGIEDAGLTVAGTTQNVALVASGTYPKRAVQAYRVSGLSGTTARLAISSAGDTEHVAAFRTTGYRPISESPWITARRTGWDHAEATLDLTVPPGGAVLIHGKRYGQLTQSPPGTVVHEPTENGLSGNWTNETDQPADIRFIFATASAIGEKYAAALILERI